MLRHVISHLRRDWTRVFIELVIVVLGVFIGLRVNNWNQARVDAELGNVQRLIRDSAEIERRTDREAALIMEVRGDGGIAAEGGSDLPEGNGICPECAEFGKTDDVAESIPHVAASEASLETALAALGARPKTVPNAAPDPRARL